MRAQGRSHSRKVLHELIPPFSATCSEKQDQGFGHITEILIVILIFAELGKAERLVHRNAKHQK